MLFKKIDVSSDNSVTSALDLFSTPPTDVSISNSQYREFLTLNPINSTPYHFKIHPITSFIDLSKCYIFTELKIVRVNLDGTNSNLDATDVVAPIQLPGATFIKNLVVTINGREVFNANQLFSYKVYLDAELSYPTGVKDSFLSVCGYARDSDDQNSINGEGYITRKNLFASSKEVQLMTKIDADLFNQDLYLINNCEVDIEISPQTSDFMLIQKEGDANRNYKFEIINCKLYVKTIDLMDGLSLDFARKLDTQPARYSLRKSMLKSLFITEGRTEFQNNIFTDEVPRRIIVGLLANSAYIGNKNKSPFNFEHFNVRDVTIIANGRQYPQAPYNLDYGNKKYIRAYHDSQENLGFAYSRESNGISYKMFRNGWCIYTFTLTNSMENDPGFELIKDGTTAISIKFSSPVPAGGVTLIAYGEVDSLMLVDRNRSLSSDVTV